MTMLYIFQINREFKERIQGKRHRKTFHHVGGSIEEQTAGMVIGYYYIGMNTFRALAGVGALKEFLGWKGNFQAHTFCQNTLYLTEETFGRGFVKPTHRLPDQQLLLIHDIVVLHQHNYHNEVVTRRV